MTGGVFGHFDHGPVHVQGFLVYIFGYVCGENLDLPPKCRRKPLQMLELSLV